MSDTSRDQITVTKAFFGVERINYKEKWGLIIQGDFKNDFYVNYFDFQGKV